MASTNAKHKVALKSKALWDATKIKALRRHLGLTQQLLADRLGIRQQTVSEWEKGIYRPRGATVTLLNLIADEAGFKYDDTSKRS